MIRPRDAHWGSRPPKSVPQTGDVLHKIIKQRVPLHVIHHAAQGTGLVESVPVIVVKKDKSREVFDRNKLFNGLLRACEKRSCR